mgnify:CR=1 FL=1
MVEFAIVLPLLVMLLFAITELGRALYQQNTLYKSVSSGARYLARVNDVSLIDGAGICTADLAGQDWPEPSRSAAENLIVYGNISGDGTPLLPNLDDDGAVTIKVKSQPLRKTDETTPTILTCVITVDAKAAFSGFFGEIVIPFTSIATFDIRAETEERYIGL